MKNDELYNLYQYAIDFRQKDDRKYWYRSPPWDNNSDKTQNLIHNTRQALL